MSNRMSPTFRAKLHQKYWTSGMAAHRVIDGPARARRCVQARITRIHLVRKCGLAVGGTRTDRWLYWHEVGIPLRRQPSAIQAAFQATQLGLRAHMLHMRYPSFCA